MGLPNTLAGITGFIAFIVVIVAMVVPSLPSSGNELNIATNEFKNQLNNSVNGSNGTVQTGFWAFVGNVTGTSGIYDFIIGFFQIQIAFIELALAYLDVYVDIVSTIPAPFYVFFLILFDSFIIAILKLIFLSGD